MAIGAHAQVSDLALKPLVLLPGGVHKGLVKWCKFCLFIRSVLSIFISFLYMLYSKYLVCSLPKVFICNFVCPKYLKDVSHTSVYKWFDIFHLTTVGFRVLIHKAMLNPRSYRSNLLLYIMILVLDVILLEFFSKHAQCSVNICGSWFYISISSTKMVKTLTIYVNDVI